MAYNHNISVKVCGNPESSGGFGPILLLNNPSFVVEDQFYVGFDKNSFFFTITTYQTQTVYKLVKNNVRSSGAFRIGSLVIAISIPKNYKLEGGYTPYDVLCALKDEFLKKCMTCKDPVRETYEYNASKIDGHVLDEVVGKFTLTCFRTPDRVMTPNGPVGYIVETEEKIKELFQDINYPEFDKFKEVVVATTVHTTSYVPISNIQIPRPKKYELIVDGQPQGNCCNLNERLKIICRSKSPLYYEDLSFVFSIQDLIDGNVSHEGVVLDTVQERVSVETESWGTPKEKKVFLAISPKEYEDYFIRNPWELKVTLLSSNTPITIVVSKERLVIALQGKEIAALKDGGIQVDTTPRSKYVVKKQELVEDILRVEVVQRKRPSPVPAGKLTVYVTFPEDKDLRGIRSVDLQAKVSTDHRPLFRKDGVSIKWYPKERCYKGTCDIQNNEVPGFPFVFAYSNQKADWESNEISTIQKKPVATFVKTHRPFTDRYRKPLVCVLVAMMALVLGGLSFVLYNNLSNEDDKQGVVGQGDFTEESIEPFLHDVDRSLNTKDLKFVTVDTLYDKYNKNKTAIDKYSQSKVDIRNICQRLSDYKAVIDFIQTGQVDSIKEIVKDDKKYKLFHTHRSFLAQIVTDEVNETIFREKYAQIKSFVGIMELYEKYGKDKGSTNINDTIGAIGESADLLDEEEVVSSTQKSRPKQKPVVNPVESKQGKNNSVGKNPNKSSRPKEKKENRYTCKLCGPNMWFTTQKKLENHMKSIHGEE